MDHDSSDDSFEENSSDAAHKLTHNQLQPPDLHLNITKDSNGRLDVAKSSELIPSARSNRSNKSSSRNIRKRNSILI